MTAYLTCQIHLPLMTLQMRTCSVTPTVICPIPMPHLSDQTPDLPDHDRHADCPITPVAGGPLQVTLLPLWPVYRDLMYLQDIIVLKDALLSTQGQEYTESVNTT